MFTIEDIFDDLLPDLVDGFQPRADQRRLADEIQSSIDSGGLGMFEAATGTGKTLSYLTPVLNSDGRFILSTGTKNLQDQLFLKDVPMLKSLFPDKRIALLKGRANYLCPRRLKRHLEIDNRSDEVAADLVSIRQWWAHTSTGDLGEVVDLEEKPGLAPLITSTRDNCLGSRCPDFLECPLYRAREKAGEADVVIVNHHLLFADLAQRDDHLRSLLPTVRGIVIDEAHQIPEIARQFFGLRLSSSQLFELGRDVDAELKLLGNDDPYCSQLCGRFRDSIVALNDRVLESQESDFSRWLTEEAEQVIAAVDDHLAALAARLAEVADRSDGINQCARRAAACLDQFALLSEDLGRDEQPVPDGAYLHWLERRDNRFVIHLSPLSIENDMKAVMEASGAAWILVSATITVDGGYSHFEQELGVTADSTACFESPFDFGNAVKGWIPKGLPEPGSDTQTVALLRETEPLIEANAGRALFLFTSYRALRAAREHFRGIDRPLIVQGQAGRTRLLTEFRLKEQAVLLATQSFWEGVDVGGSDLRLLVIDKVPFPNPSDPLVNAQSTQLQLSGRNSFSELALPRAIIALKQGFGRLIRRESDQGVFVLGDSRLLERSYGKVIRDNLPPIDWQDNSGPLQAWLKSM